jgi:hypothetical protein
MISQKYTDVSSFGEKSSKKKDQNYPRKKNTDFQERQGYREEKESVIDFCNDSEENKNSFSEKDVSDEITLTSLDFEKEFIEAIMNGKIDKQYLKKKYPQIEDRQLGELEEKFNEFCLSTENEPAQEEPDGDILVWKSDWDELKNQLRKNKSKNLPCNVMGCSNFVIFGKKTKKKILEMDDVDPRYFFCQECREDL